MESPSRPHFYVSVVLLTLLFCSAASCQDALLLLHKMQTALGGAEKIASVRDFEESVRADAWYSDGRPLGEVRKRTRWITPNYLRLDQVGPGDTYVLYFDGTSGWEILPDKTVANLAGGELEFAKKYVRDFQLDKWLGERDSRSKITSSRRNAIRIPAGGGRTPENSI